jgi:hypothetical protein
MKQRTRWLPWLAVAVIAIGVINFLAFFILSLAIGGDALNGHATDGHYFVANHGSYTEVPQGLWIFSRIQGLLLFGSWPFVMLAMAFLLFRYVFPYLTAGRSPGDADARVTSIRVSGPALWSGSPGGVVGDVRASVGMLTVAVHPSGLVGNLRFTSPFAIPADEIRSVRFGRRSGASTIEVEHAGTDVASPLILYGGEDSPQATAISQLQAREGVSTGVAVPAGPPTARPQPPGPLRAMSVIGLFVGVVLIGAGIFWAIPTFGPFGFVWTGVAVVIEVINARRFFQRGW